LKTALERLEQQMRLYARRFLKAEYGEQALKKLKTVEIKAVDAYDSGGVSEATEKEVKIAAKRDVNAGKLTNTTKLILRHELGHVLDENSPAFPDFDEEIEHEKIAWAKAKPKTPAENWYKNISVRTHIDPLRMQALGFPRPERKVSSEKLEWARGIEIQKMSKSSPFVDANLAERFAMVNLVGDPEFYVSSAAKASEE